MIGLFPKPHIVITIAIGVGWGNAIKRDWLTGVTAQQRRKPALAQNIEGWRLRDDIARLIGISADLGDLNLCLRQRLNRGPFIGDVARRWRHHQRARFWTSNRYPHAIAAAHELIIVARNLACVIEEAQQIPQMML